MNQSQLIAKEARPQAPSLTEICSLLEEELRRLDNVCDIADSMRGILYGPAPQSTEKAEAQTTVPTEDGVLFVLGRRLARLQRQVGYLEHSLRVITTGLKSNGGQDHA